MEGYQVTTMGEAAAQGDIFCHRDRQHPTGNIDVITIDHMRHMKDGDCNWVCHPLPLKPER
jgi:adenosylhomocysteinase